MRERNVTVGNFEIRVEDVEEQHIGAYAELSRSEYGAAAIADPTHLRWKFLDNPAGVSKGIHLFADGALVARLVAQPSEFVIGDRTSRAAYIVDLLVHPQYRGMASLSRLLGALPRLRESFDFILVTPNAGGLQVWERFVKLPGRFDLGVHVVPLRPAHLAARAWRPAEYFATAFDRGWPALARIAATLATFGVGPRLESAWPSVAELDGLLLATTQDGYARGRRTAAFFEWRYRRSPVFRYDVDFLRVGGRLAGYVVSRRTVYDGYDTRFIVDVFGTSLTRRDWATIGWRLVAREAGRDGAELMMIIGNTACGPLTKLAKPPFIRVPAQLLPQRTTVFADWWSEPAFDLTADGLALTLGDCDMI